MSSVVHSEKRTVPVYRSRAEIALLAGDEVLDGADVVPGWTLPIREIFA